MFLERCLELCVEGGTASLVLPQNWLFLTSYRKLREKLLKSRDVAFAHPARDQGGFEHRPLLDASCRMLTLSRGNSTGHAGGLFGKETAACTMYGLDVSESPAPPGEKATRLPEAEITGVEQLGSWRIRIRTSLGRYLRLKKDS